MVELQLTLAFACCQCEERINIKVQCQGKGLAAGPRAVAAAEVPCPFCGNVNQVCFHPTGAVVAVNAAGSLRRLPAPSVN